MSKFIVQTDFGSQEAKLTNFTLRWFNLTPDFELLWLNFWHWAIILSFKLNNTTQIQNSRSS